VTCHFSRIPFRTPLLSTKAYSPTFLKKQSNEERHSEREPKQPMHNERASQRPIGQMDPKGA
jgi:hypothetical protein